MAKKDFRRIDIKWFPKDHECPISYLKFTYDGKPLGARRFSKQAALEAIDRAMLRSGDYRESTKARLIRKTKRYKRLAEEKTLFDQYVEMTIGYKEALEAIGRHIDPNPTNSVFSTIMSQKAPPSFYVNFAISWARDLARKQKQAD